MWVNGLELTHYRVKQSRSRPEAAGVVVAIERCLAEYYVVGDADHHRLRGGPVAVPVRSAAQAACHAPLAEVLDDYWSLSVNDLQTVFVVGWRSDVCRRLVDGGRGSKRREDGVLVRGDQM
jgi:hypothetical protein